MLCRKRKGEYTPDLLLDSLLIQTFESASQKGNDNAILLQCLFLRVVMRYYVQKCLNLYLCKPVQRARIEYRVIILSHSADGIKWADGRARIVIGIAAKNDDHMAILANIAEKLGEMEMVEKVVAGDVDTVYEILAGDAA